MRSRIAAAAENAGRRPESITLLGAAKAQPAQAVQAAIVAGVRVIGENYLDDAAAHQGAIGRHSAQWHFIGPVQSNKTRDIAARFDCVQSLHRDKIARRLNDQRPANSPPLHVLVQVNISNEATKAGLPANEVCQFCEHLANYPRLRLEGLMAIPAPGHDNATEELAALLQAVRAITPTARTLSIGMSGDLETAIAGGSTMVRIGTDLFGPRPANTHSTRSTQP